jgi:hypothetical protein
MGNYNARGDDGEVFPLIVTVDADADADADADCHVAMKTRYRTHSELFRLFH